MTIVVSVCVAVLMTVSLFLLLGRELKEVAMGLFLISHAAHLSILVMSGSPFREEQPSPQQVLPYVADYQAKTPPVLESAVGDEPLLEFVDPLPQALILTSIVISFAVMAFLLTLLVITARATRTIDLDRLSRMDRPTPSTVD